MFESSGEPKWQAVFDIAKGANIGRLFTYVELEERTGFDIKAADRNTIYHANSRLLKMHKRMLVNVRGQGYEVASAPKQFLHGRKRRVRSRRQIDKGILELTHIDTTKMSPDERLRTTHLVNHFVNVQRELRKRQTETWQKTQEAADSQKQSLRDLDKLARELDQLRQRLSTNDSPEENVA